MKKLIFLGIIALLLVTVSSCGCLGFFEGYTKKAQEYTSADYSIDKYKFFIDKFNAIRSIGAQILVIQQEMDSYQTDYPKPWGKTVADNYEELRFNKNGLVAQYNAFVGEYNSRMRDLTTNQAWMKPQNFPESLPLYSPNNLITMDNPELSYK